MAINITPGVGPQNSDIAAAVAAPSISSITSAITTNAASAGVTLAAIGTQVVNNAPTASAIATAVAAPSAATIAAAVAAPSISSITSAITTNAASAGVTNASIATQVANNAPSPNAWTYLGATNFAANSSVTISGLASYRTYKILMPVNTGFTSATVGMRINGDSGTTYNWWGFLIQGGASSPTTYNSSVNNTYFPAYSPGTGNNCSFETTIEFSALAAAKLFTHTHSDTNLYYYSHKGAWANTGTISSFNFFTTGGQNISSGSIYVYGAN